jgi:hypothetical protein
MENNVEDPWFRRAMFFGYRPINRKGWISMGVTAAITLPCAYLFVAMDGWMKWLCGALAFVAALIFNGLALWHMEER